MYKWKVKISCCQAFIVIYLQREKLKKMQWESSLFGTEWCEDIIRIILWTIFHGVLWGRESCSTTTPTLTPDHPSHSSGHRALNLTPRDHPGRACQIAFPTLPRKFLDGSLGEGETDTVAGPSNKPPSLLSPPRSLRRSRLWHRRQNPRRGLWMAEHQGGRGRAKRRRCAFVVGEECGNVPAPCQTSLKGVRPTFSRRGKTRQRRSSHGRARLQLHRPIRGYMQGGEKKERKE